MRPLLKFAACILLAWILIFLSCKKEYSCEGCAEKNKPPVAVAGPDQIITLPTDSVSLDGSASSDPDGTISTWLWTKISGPSSFNINNASIAKTIVKSLAAGSYQFELKVKDNGGLSAKDTVQVIVNGPGQLNRPPVANAGTDQTITLPTNTVNLDGSGSTDPDNNITSYAWTKISGPSSFNISNANAVQTQVNNLVQGTYQFELKVADAGNLFSKDTIQVIVNNQVTSCNITQTFIGNLSVPRYYVRICAAGNKILFAGGHTDPGPPSINNTSSRVDIYDIVSNTWAITELSVARYGMTTIAAGNRIFFAGGQLGDGSLSTRVDIYDVSSNTWTTAELSEARMGIYSIAAGSKVLFAGGGLGGTNLSTRVDIYDQAINTWTTTTLLHISGLPKIMTSLGSKIFFSVDHDIDIYDASNNNWSTMQLSQPRYWPSPVVLGNKIYFGGGESAPQVVSNMVDIYDGTTNSWSTTTLVHAKYALSISSITAGDKIFWAGGVDSINEINGGCNSDVEVYDVITGTHSFHPLLDCYLKPFLVNNKVVFFGYNVPMADVYNLADQSWSICNVTNMNQDIVLANNKIYGLVGSAVYSFVF